MKIEKYILLNICIGIALALIFLTQNVSAKTIINVSQEFGGYGNTFKAEEYDQYLPSYFILNATTENVGFSTIYLWKTGDLYLLDYDGYKWLSTLGSLHREGRIISEDGEHIAGYFQFNADYNSTLYRAYAHLYSDNIVYLKANTKYRLEYKDPITGDYTNTYAGFGIYEYSSYYFIKYYNDENLPPLKIGYSHNYDYHYIIAVFYPDTQIFWYSYTTPYVTSHLLYATNLTTNEVFNLTYVMHNNFTAVISVFNLDTNQEEISKTFTTKETYYYSNSTLANRRIYIDYYESGDFKERRYYDSEKYTTGAGYGYKLSGYVIDSKTFSPIPYAVVTLDNSQVGVFYDIADNNGFFEITNIPKAEYDLTASKNLYHNFTSTIYMDKNYDITLYLTPKISAEEYLYNNTIYGYVVDTKSYPVKEAYISLTNKSTNDLYMSILTNEYGYFELFNITSGNYAFKAEKEGYLTYTEDIFVEENTYYYRNITLVSKSEAIQPRSEAQAKEFFENTMIGFISGESGKMPSEIESFKFLLAIAILLLVIGIFDLIFGKKGRK